MNQKIERYQCSRRKVNIGNCYVASADLPSVSFRNKAPELYQNGRIQRIRAAEGNLLDSEIIHKDTFSGHFSKMEKMPTNNFSREDSILAKGNAPSEDPSKMAQGLSTGKAEQGMKLGCAESSDNKPVCWGRLM